MRGGHVAVMLGPPEVLVGSSDVFENTVRKRLEEYGVYFENAEEPNGFASILVNATRSFYGLGRFVTLEEAGVSFASLSDDSARVRPPPTFLQWESTCPFLAELVPIGFIEFEDVSAADRSSFLTAITVEGKGLIASLERDVPARPAIIERTFCLSTLQSKYGFDDGDVLLTRKYDELCNYREEVWGQIRETLQANGIEHHFGGPDSTIHNPYRSAGPFHYHGKEITSEDEMYSILSSVNVKLWVYDFKIDDDRSLFPL